MSTTGHHCAQPSTTHPSQLIRLHLLAVAEASLSPPPTSRALEEAASLLSNARALSPPSPPPAASSFHPVQSRTMAHHRSDRRDRSRSRSRSCSPRIGPSQPEPASTPPRPSSPSGFELAAPLTVESSGEAGTAASTGGSGTLSAVLSPTRLPRTLPEDPASPAGRRARAELRESLCVSAHRTGLSRVCT